jgi:hypothetical protein
MVLGTLYMIPKYSLRFVFYRTVVWYIKHMHPRHSINSFVTSSPSISQPPSTNLYKSSIDIREVRNPRKVHKLAEIARNNGIDEHAFIDVATKWLRWWPLLP